MAETKELRVKEKQENLSPAEQTKTGPVFTPSVDIFENDREIMLLADMPGVTADGVKIDLHEDILTLSGDVESMEGPNETNLLTEFETGRYYRQFTLSDVIDQNKIDAKLENGVLRLALPKGEKAVPRRITVNAG